MNLKHPVVHGHPLHAIASDLPAALIPAALLAAAVERARPNERTRYGWAKRSSSRRTSAATRRRTYPGGFFSRRRARNPHALMPRPRCVTARRSSSRTRR